MKRFINQLFIFFILGLVPFFIFSFLYVYLDPFKVLYSYKDYSFPFVITNRDYISTTILKKNLPEHKYNSFVLGSSRTLAYRLDCWNKYLDKNAKPFMFDASNESVYGIYTKLRYLDSIKANIENVLIIMCRDRIFEDTENPKGHLFIKHPATSGESNLDFQLVFFKAYLDPGFLFNFYAYIITKEYKPFMGGYIENRLIRYDTLTNEYNAIDQQKEITQNPVAYYAKRADYFYDRQGEKIDTAHKIKSKHLFMLQEIKRILVKNNTNYKVVISPLYEQVKFSKYDFEILKSLFGNNLFDFSGRNIFTESMVNYYEPSHYIPKVGDSILSLIYRDSTRNIQHRTMEQVVNP